MGQNTLIHLTGVCKSFTNAQGESTGVLRDVDIDVTDGTLMAVVGLNGAGKTTLLRLIAGMEKPDAGEIKILCESAQYSQPTTGIGGVSPQNKIPSLNMSRVPAVQARSAEILSEQQGVGGGSPKLGYVWQDYRSSLLPWYDAADNIALPLKAEGMNRKERREKAVELLREVGEPFAPDARIYNLSGGQQQLIAILRSVVVSPDVMLMDEPLSALDQLRAWEVSLLLEKLWLKRKPPMLFISHDIDDAILLANEILFVSKSHGGVAARIKVELPRPRTIPMLASPAVQEIRSKIFALFDAEKRLTTVPWKGK
jgi:NitT/TauT family transport system ATP-binding protein